LDEELGYFTCCVGMRERKKLLYFDNRSTTTRMTEWPRDGVILPQG